MRVATSHPAPGGLAAAPPALRVTGRRALLQQLALLAAGCAPLPARDASDLGPADYNPGGIAWRAYDEGVAAARAQNRPITLVFYTDWCPHCHAYSRLFHAPEVVRLAAEFVMIRVDRDENRELSARHDIDGDYIPRTFFLGPSGAVLTELTSDDEDFLYYLDEDDPTELIALMQRALALVRAAGER